MPTRPELRARSEPEAPWPALRGALGTLTRQHTPMPAEYAKGKARAKRMMKILQNGLHGVRGVGLIGSVAKRTAISPVTDIDMIVYLHREVWEGEDRRLLPPRDLLKKVQDRILQTWAPHVEAGRCSVRAQNHSLGLRFRAEGEQHIDFVPAIVQGRELIAQIPERSRNTYITTGVNRQMAELRRRDGPGDPLRRGIRLLKLWRTWQGLRFIPSYALELVAMYRFAHQPPVDEAHVLHAVLSWISQDRLRQSVYLGTYIERFDVEPAPVRILDLAVPGNNVTARLTDADKERWIDAATQTLERLNQLNRAPATTGGPDGLDRRIERAMRRRVCHRG